MIGNPIALYDDDFVCLHASSADISAFVMTKEIEEYTPNIITKIKLFASEKGKYRVYQKAGYFWTAKNLPCHFREKGTFDSVGFHSFGKYICHITIYYNEEHNRG